MKMTGTPNNKCAKLSELNKKKKKEEKFVENHGW